MPSSGARSGTRPSRSERGAGSGNALARVALACGHGTEGEPIALTMGVRYYVCAYGCGLQKAKR